MRRGPCSGHPRNARKAMYMRSNAVYVELDVRKTREHSASARETRAALLFLARIDFFKLAFRLFLYRSPNTQRRRELGLGAGEHSTESTGDDKMCCKRFEEQLAQSARSPTSASINYRLLLTHLLTKLAGILRDAEKDGRGVD